MHQRDHARSLAGSGGADHVEVDFGESDFWALLPRVAADMDDPAEDYAWLSTYKLAMRASQQVKGILSGESGDELLGGYGRYRGAMPPWPLSHPMRRNGTFDGLRVLRPLPGWCDRFALEEKAATLAGRSRLHGAQAIDCADWLPNDLLIKADRCLMANAIEGRVPFLDPEVAEFAFTLPDRFKIRNGLGKHLLRLWLERAMPAARPFDKKRGFTVPVGEWISARPDIGALVATQPGIAEIALPGQVEKLFAAAAPKTGFARWSLLFYALWHQIHILGVPADGDAFDTLSTR
uniref:asparagine synthase (glutamine-hydrolyzing) n=1 Tax=Magnetospirillum gryphiswaldense TaxID=55518 RepID=A4TV17_9PROT|nr:asparagine synthetase [Magnetospirillum gryphiswaldense MSR-1]